MGPLLNHVDEMSRGIYYKFEEKEKYENKIINIDDFIEEIDSSYSSMSNSVVSADSDDNYNYTYNDNENLIHTYSTNYNVKSLSQIMDYYELSKKNMRKDEMIQHIILFELNPINTKLVDKRRCLWNYMNELKKDKFFSKLIIW
jgi:hypothetical protein